MSIKKPIGICLVKVYGAKSKPELNGTPFTDTWDNIINIHLPNFKKQNNCFECGVELIQDNLN